MNITEIYGIHYHNIEWNVYSCGSSVSNVNSKSCQVSQVKTSQKLKRQRKVKRGGLSGGEAELSLFLNLIGDN